MNKILSLPGRPATLPREAVSLVVGRGISTLGTTLSMYGLDVWVFRTTGSYAIFAYLAVLCALPSLLFAPFAGVIADRYNKRSVLLGCDICALAVTLLALVLAQSGMLSVTAVALVLLVLALAAELRWSVMGATIAQIVPAPQLGAINGMQQSFRGAAAMLGPMLGAVALGALGLPLLLALDALSYVIGIAGLLMLPRALTKPGPAGPRVRFLVEMRQGFGWTFAHPGLRRLLLFFMCINIGMAVFTVTLTPYVLSFASNAALGVTLGLQGGGAFVTGLLLGRLRHAGHHEAGILWGSLLVGIGIVLWGISRQPAAIWTIAFCMGALSSVILASSQSIWQIHVPAHLQGKVFGVRTVFSFGLTPIAILLSVPMAAHVFAPTLAASPALAGIWGNGRAGPLGLMASAFGAAIALCAAAMIARGGLRLQKFPTNVPPSINR